VKRTARKFRSFSEAEKADHDFYKKLTGNERLQILVELLNHGPELRLERVSRIIKFPRRWLRHCRRGEPRISRAPISWHWSETTERSVAHRISRISPHSRRTTA